MLWASGCNLLFFIEVGGLRRLKFIHSGWGVSPSFVETKFVSTLQRFANKVFAGPQPDEASGRGTLPRMNTQGDILGTIACWRSLPWPILGNYWQPSFALREKERRLGVGAGMR